MDFLYTILSFSVVICIIVFVHELGHYLAARLTGMRVEVFSLGFGKSIFQFQKGDTIYKLSMIPLGGYVKIAGMVDESLDGKESIEKKDDEFESKNSLQKLFVLSAGVIMNFLLAIFLYTLIIYSQGVGEINGTYIGSFQENFPAKDSGLMINDKIIKINSKPISEWEEISSIVHSKPNEEISITVNRAKEELTFKIKTIPTETVLDGKKVNIGLLGIGPSIVKKSLSFYDSFIRGLDLTYNWTKMSVMTIKMLISGEAGVKDLGGPVMIAKMSGDSAKNGFISFLGFIAFLSINIGFLNLLPIPALDGGHMVYVIIEAITRRKLSFDLKVKIQTFGMLFLFTLMIVVIFNDISRVFSG
ncbi:MAG: RIP metalloprotease RseP [Candidatus Cloacimonadota bacterium]|nr:MAG: RIP metalloprotease RseP [Candidatus Cloacimonadota bacterium]PIE78128.1 MAG: RIP metalloprotease RseP [Candidatus Delongbacteria bacterium]